LSSNAKHALDKSRKGRFTNQRGFTNMSNVRAVPTSTEGLRTAAHDIANALCATDVGGECYHGGQHQCFTLQGRKPLPLYKVEEMCERCAAAWHAVMAASLLDSVIISQQFLGEAPKNALEQQFLRVEHGSNGAAVHGKTVRARGGRVGRRRKPAAAPKASRVKVEGEGSNGKLAIEPSATGKYSPEERKQMVAFYQTLPRSAKAPFNLRYKVKAWQMRDWAK
jgi:hypothetical protein